FLVRKRFIALAFCGVHETLWLLSASLGNKSAGSGTSSIPHDVHRNRKPSFSAVQIRYCGNFSAYRTCEPAHTTQSTEGNLEAVVRFCGRDLALDSRSPN